MLTSMPASIIVRSATESDSSNIAALLSELGYRLEVAQVRDNIALLSSSASDRVLVAEAMAGTTADTGAKVVSSIVGVLSFHVIPLFHVVGNLGRITSLVVNAQWQRRGVGSQLLQAAEEFGWSQGCVRIEVTSGDRRAGAHEFYQRWGYQCDERRFIKCAADGKETRAPLPPYPVDF